MSGIARRIGCGRAMRFFVGGVQHELCATALEQHPIDIVAAAAALCDLKADDVAIERERNRHVEDLQQRREAADFDSHECLRIYGMETRKNPDAPSSGTGAEVSFVVRTFVHD